MEGILLIDKPQGFTSFDVVAKLRGILGIRRVGHAGTLDPMATGVLPVFVGGATRAMNLLPDTRKRYTAFLRLGIITDTQDFTGSILETRPVAVGTGAVESALDGFRGRYMQIPPMYSAVKINGKKLYELARKGQEIERKPRPVIIEEITLLDSVEESGDYVINVLCSGGTYIRTLCHDLGEKLGCGAVLTGLRRTMAAGFPIQDCITIEQAQALVDSGSLAQMLISVERIFEAYPRLDLDQRQERLFRNGVRLALLSPGESGETKRCRVYDAGGDFFAVADIDIASGVLISRKMFGGGEAL